MRLALYQPDIPQNTGSILRLGACLDVPVDIIEPCGFPLSDRGLKRAGMDYIDRANMHQHVNWAAFEEFARTGNHRLILLTTRGSIPYTEVLYRPSDILLLGRESAGVPESVHERADIRTIIPMRSGARSINVAQSAAMVAGEALRQTGGFALPDSAILSC